MNNIELERIINQLLDVQSYKDYAPNGLQVAGTSEVNRVVFGVTASLELIEAAIEHQADAIIVHHGYFWKGENQTITGMKRRRIKKLLMHDINLYGYHLPLDGHATLGNNARLGDMWKIENACVSPSNNLLWCGDIVECSAEDFSHTLHSTLQRTPLLLSGGEHTIKKLAWCSGGAQGFLEQAVALGADAFVSGEVSEKTFHEAKEYGIHYFAAGHHATERCGIQALCEHLDRETDLTCIFVDCWNPV